MVRIAIPLIGGNQWQGGRNYMINLLQVLKELGSGQVEPILFLGEEDDVDNDLPSIGDVHIVRNNAFDLTEKQGRLAKSLIAGVDSKAAHLFKQHGIDCAFETAQFYGWRFPVPVLAWIPDFQHRHMPHLFSTAAWWKRDLGFQAQVASGRHIMLSSEDARKDCEHFYPRSKGRTSVVRFATQLPTPAHPDLVATTRRKYGLPLNYIFLPNQFWTHKNHEVVIRALAILKAKGVAMCVAATGHTHDPRAPLHFDRLQKLNHENGLEDYFRILGSIAFGDVQALMQGCSALINPSYFEGWSTTVEEAKACGVPLILSDLDVHREQALDKALYFDPDRPDQLANIIQNYSATERLQKSSLDALVRQRRTSFVNAFESAVFKAVGQY